MTSGSHLFIRAFTVMCWMRSSAMMKKAMSSLLSHHWRMNKKQWSLNPGTPDFHSTVGVICRRGHSGSSTQQSPEFTLIRKKLRGALGSNQIFMRMAYLNENFLLYVYANFDSTSYSTVIDAHRCYSQDDAGRLLSAWKCYTLWAYKSLIGKDQTNKATRIRVLLYTKP